MLDFLILFYQILFKSGALGMSLGYREGGLGTETLPGPPKHSSELKIF
jgi:hypothetical protein